MTRPSTAGILAALLLASALGCSHGASSSEQGQWVSDSLPSQIRKTDINFDDKVRLVGFAVSPSLPKYPAGTKVTASLVWHAEGKVEPGYALFTHLVGSNGALVLNLDTAGPLRRVGEGSALTPSRWQLGKYYRDEISFDIPEGAPPTVGIAAGFYKGPTRLPIKGGSEADNGRANIVWLPTESRPSPALIKELSVAKLPQGTVLTIDGNLSEPAWATAATTGPFVDVGSGRPSSGFPTQGRARLLWDDTFLYVGFDVEDTKVHGGWPAGAKDPHLWEKDTVEIMIDPDGDGDNKDYYEIQINPQNLVFDTQYDDYNSPNGNGHGPFGHEEWTAGLTSAVQVHGTIDNDRDVDRGYTVEAKIPWASFTKALSSPPKPGSTWRMNFYAMKNNGGTAWSPILGMGNFHRASRFGRVRWTQ